MTPPGQELELAQDAQIIPNPFTGESIDLAGETEDLARAIKALRDLDDERKALVRTVSRTLLSRMDANAKWTIHFGGLDVVSSAPGKVEYPGDKLKAVLEGLVKEGLITQEAALNAIERTVSYKAKKRGVDNLMKLGGEVAKRLRAIQARIPDEKRSVTVKVPDGVVDA